MCVCVKDDETCGCVWFKMFDDIEALWLQFAGVAQPWPTKSRRGGR